MGAVDGKGLGDTLVRYKEGDCVYVVSWDAGGIIVEDCDTGYWVRGNNFSDFIADHDVEGAVLGRIGATDGRA